MDEHSAFRRGATRCLWIDWWRKKTYKYTRRRPCVAYLADNLQQGFDLWLQGFDPWFPLNAGRPRPWVFLSSVSSFPDSQWSESYHNGRLEGGGRDPVGASPSSSCPNHRHVTMEFRGNFPQAAKHRGWYWELTQMINGFRLFLVFFLPEEWWEFLLWKLHGIWIR